MTKPTKNTAKPAAPVKTAKSEKEGFGSYGARLRVVRESLGISRPKFAVMLHPEFPVTTLKNYELGYRQMAPEVATYMEASEMLAPYVNYVMFGKAEITAQMMPDARKKYDPYEVRAAAGSRRDNTRGGAC